MTSSPKRTGAKQTDVRQTCACAENVRSIIAAGVVACLLLAASFVKYQSANRAIPEAQRFLAVGSSFIASQPIAPDVRAAEPSADRAADPNALVTSGPPRMFHLDPAHSNRSPFRGPATPSLSVLADLRDPIQTAPAILGDGTIVVATLAGNVYGIRFDGTRAFTTNMNERVYASPLVVGNQVFFGSDHGRFVRISSTGGIGWSLSTDGDADTSATPAPNKSIVFAADNTLYCTRTDGTVMWRVRAKRKIYSSPAVDSDGTVFVGAQDHRLYGVSSTGTVRFATNLGHDIDCAPSIGERGSVYVGTDGGTIAAIDKKSGSVVWQKPVGGHVRGGLTLTRSHDVVAGLYGPSPRVVCLHGATGELLWSFSVPGTGAKEHGVHGSPVEDKDGNLYFGSQDNAVYSLTARGELRWKVGTGGDIDAPVVLVSDGVLLAASDDGKLYRVVEP